jgi:hypothetical protein
MQPGEGRTWQGGTAPCACSRGLSTSLGACAGPACPCAQGTPPCGERLQGTGWCGLLHAGSGVATSRMLDCACVGSSFLPSPCHSGAAYALPACLPAPFVQRGEARAHQPAPDLLHQRRPGLRRAVRGCCHHRQRAAGAQRGLPPGPMHGCAVARYKADAGAGPRAGAAAPCCVSLCPPWSCGHDPCRRALFCASPGAATWRRSSAVAALTPPSLRSRVC